MIRHGALRSQVRDLLVGCTAGELMAAAVAAPSKLCGPKTKRPRFLGAVREPLLARRASLLAALFLRRAAALLGSLLTSRLLGRVLHRSILPNIEFAIVQIAV